MIYNILGLWLASAILNIVVLKVIKPVEFHDKTGILISVGLSVIIAPFVSAMWLVAFFGACIVGLFDRRTM